MARYVEFENDCGIDYTTTTNYPNENLLQLPLGIYTIDDYAFLYTTTNIISQRIKINVKYFRFNEQTMSSQ